MKNELEKRLQFVAAQCDQALANYNAALGARSELLFLLNQLNAKEAENAAGIAKEVEDTEAQKEEVAA